MDDGVARAARRRERGERLPVEVPRASPCHARSTAAVASVGGADCVRRSLDTTAEQLDIKCEIKEIRALSPERPVPRYRMASAVERTGPL